MPYVVEKDTSVPRVVAEGEGPNGHFREVERVPYAEGAVVYEQDITPEMVDRLEDGDDDHLASILRHVSEEDAEKILAERGQSPPVAPEHEAEAEVLYQDGQDVLTREEVVESNPNGDPVAVEEVPPDLTEGRESSDPESIRVKEVDERRRGEGEAPQPKPAAGEESSESDSSKKELQDEAKDLGVEGYKSMNKEELADAIAEAREQRSQSQQAQTQAQQTPGP